jgi:26S proteasome regulatory subunit T5
MLQDLQNRSDAEIQHQTIYIENQINTIKADLRFLGGQQTHMEDETRSNREKVRLNKTLPFLVAHVIETLPLPDDEIPDVKALHRDGSIPRPDEPGPLSVVVKTTTRETVFLPQPGLVPAEELRPSDMVGLSKDSYLIFEKLPQHLDSRVKAMEVVSRPKSQDERLGGLDKQIQELREAVVFPLRQPEKGLMQKLGIQPPKGVLLYGPPGTGKTMLARACAAETDSTFLRLAGPQLVQMFVGEGSRLVRNAFELARTKAPAIIFIDEIDAIGVKRSSGEGLQGEREVQRTLLELLNQLDGFSALDDVKVICATNRPDTLDPALMRSGRLDRKIELPMPNEDARCAILEIHSAKMSIGETVNYREIARSTEDFNGAMLKAICVEAGMVALRRGREVIEHEDYVEGIAQVQAKKRAVLEYFA